MTAAPGARPKCFITVLLGRVKALQAAMLPDGTAMAVYSLDRSGTGNTSDYEIAYCTVDADGMPGTAMLATCDSNLDEKPPGRCSQLRHRG